MIGGRTERKHNSDDQVREYLAGALAIVGELEVPDDLRVAAFGKAVDLLAAKHITFETVAPVGNGLAGLLGS